MTTTLDFVLPVAAGVSGLFAGGAVLYNKLRPYFPSTVNCWFCNHTFRIAYRNCNNFVCPSCQQYNGFNEDGDYNRDLPAQRCESLNFTPVRSRRHTEKENSNGFCQTCNDKLALKVRALAEYTPINDDNYDTEIEEYRKRLDRSYSLCRQCEGTLHQALGKQDSWIKPKLMAWRLKRSAERRAVAIQDSIHTMSGLPVYISFLHILCTLTSLCLVLVSIDQLQKHSGTHLLSLDFGLHLEAYLEVISRFSTVLVITGLTLLLSAIFISGKYCVMISDAVASFLWVGLLAVCSSQKLLTPADFHSAKVLLSGIIFVVMIWVTLIPRSAAFCPQSNPVQLNRTVIMATNCNDSRTTPDVSLNDECKMLTPSSVDLQCNIMPTPYSSKSRIEVNLDSNLGCLQICTPNKALVERPVPSNSPFSAISARGLFSDSSVCGSRLSRPPVLSPAAIFSPGKNITKSSWVAGGLWNPPSNVLVFPSRCFSPPIFGESVGLPQSRCSSQSSGFFSQGSVPSEGLPPGSFESSLCDGDSLFYPTEGRWGSAHYPSSINPCDSASQLNLRYRGHPQSDGSTVHSDSTEMNLTVPDIKDASREPYAYGEKSRSAWVAFVLGMSIAANGFFISLMLIRSLPE